MTPRKKDIGCAVVGYGGALNMGRYHATRINAAPGLATVAACDTDPARMKAAAADFPDIATYTDYGRCLADPNVDLAVIVTPHNTHAELGLAAIKAGKHVVLEKPMCLHAAEATEIIEAARKAGVVLTTFHNRRHDGDFVAMKEVIAKGIIGEVFHAEYYMGFWEPPPKTWRSDKAISGGLLYDWGAHIVDWVLHFIPEKIESVFGVFQRRVWMGATNEDQVQAIIRFAGGKVGDIQLSNVSGAGKPHWRILGTKGAIIQEWKPNCEWNDHFKVFTTVGGYPAEMTVRHKQSTWDEWYPNLAAHLLRGARLEVTPESSRRVIAVIETAGKSAKSGKAEPVPFE